MEQTSERVFLLRDGQRFVEKRDQVLRRVKTWFAHVPASESLVEHLLAERRAEARREDRA